MMHKQLSLFGKDNKPLHSNVTGTKRRKRKYSLSHWSYRQRLIHEVSQSSRVSWKDVYKLLNMALSHQQIALPTKSGRRFVSTVNQSALSKAVIVMYQRRHGRSNLSINKIVKKYGVSAPTLYRAYKKRFKKGNE